MSDLFPIPPDGLLPRPAGVEQVSTFTQRGIAVWPARTWQAGERVSAGMMNSWRDQLNDLHEHLHYGWIDWTSTVSIKTLEGLLVSGYTVRYAMYTRLAPSVINVCLELDSVPLNVSTAEIHVFGCPVTFYSSYDIFPISYIAPAIAGRQGYCGASTDGSFRIGLTGGLIPIGTWSLCMQGVLPGIAP